MCLPDDPVSLCGCTAHVELRDMSKKADAEKQEKERTAATLDSIEAAARKQFEADQAAAEAQAGKWVWNESSGYYYNAMYR